MRKTSVANLNKVSDQPLERVDLGISVIIPFFNNPGQLFRATLSVLSQTELPREIILIDDGSNETESCLVEQLLSELKTDIAIKLTKTKNEGPSSARLTGIRQSESDWIALLDSDETWHPKWLEITKKIIENEKPTTPLVISANRRLVTRNRNISYASLDEQPYGIKRKNRFSLILSNFIPTSTVVAKKLDLWSSFIPGIRYGEDYIAWLLSTNNQTLFIKVPQDIAYMYKPAVGYGGQGKNYLGMKMNLIRNLFNPKLENRIGFSERILIIALSLIKIPCGYMRIVYMNFLYFFSSENILNTKIKILNSLNFIPDKIFLDSLLLLRFGPTVFKKDQFLFQKKIQKYKLAVDQAHALMVDKIGVKKLITQKFPRIKVARTKRILRNGNLAEIPYTDLPAVLKVSNGTNSTLILEHLWDLETQQLQQVIDGWLARNMTYYREYLYQSVKPEAFIEERIESSLNAPNDYKFFCFDGHVELFLFCTDRYGTAGLRKGFFELDGSFIDLGIAEYSFNGNGGHLELLNQFSDAVKFASQLSRGHKFLRVDVYLEKEDIYFGECTFFDASGFKDYGSLNQRLGMRFAI